MLILIVFFITSDIFFNWSFYREFVYKNTFLNLKSVSDLMIILSVLLNIQPNSIHVYLSMAVEKLILREKCSVVIKWFINLQLVVIPRKCVPSAVLIIHCFGFTFFTSLISPNIYIKISELGTFFIFMESIYTHRN